MGKLVNVVETVKIHLIPLKAQENIMEEVLSKNTFSNDKQIILG